jgi:hypothetical protein
MACNNCKYYVFVQNDMLGSCKLNPVVVNKSPSDWCGQEQPKEIKLEVVVESPVPNVVYDINTDEVKKRGRKKNVKSSL